MDSHLNRIDSTANSPQLTWEPLGTGTYAYSWEQAPMLAQGLEATVDAAKRQLRQWSRRTAADLALDDICLDLSTVRLEFTLIPGEYDSPPVGLSVQATIGRWSDPEIGRRMRKVHLATFVRTATTEKG